MSDWNNRTMFDRYLYDYMRKNNMHQTADIFKEEANVVQPSVPPEIDVPDGFLQEWWLTFYEMYRSLQPRNHVPGEGSNTMQIMGASRQKRDPSPPHVLTDADSWFNTGINAMGSRRSPLMGAKRVPKGASSSSHQHNLLASKSVPYLPGNVANLPAQEVLCSGPAASRKAKDIASEEGNDLILPPPVFDNYVLNSIWVTEKHQQELRDKSLLAQRGGKSTNSTDTIDGNSSGSCDMNTTSDASLKCKSNDDNVKSSSPHTNGNKDNADSSSSKLPECAASADDLKVHQVVESKKEGVVESTREGVGESKKEG